MNKVLKLNKVLKSLDEVFEECSEKGWDGYDARPITEDTYIEAIRLIRSLPLTSSIPMPEVIPEPSGEIALEWSKGKRFTLVISASGKNEIIYAFVHIGSFGMVRTHGTEYFGDSLPLVLKENLEKLYCGRLYYGF